MKLDDIETKTIKSEDRLRHMYAAVDEEKATQHKLTELVGRILAKKHNMNKQLEQAASTAKNLEAETSVSHSTLHVIWLPS